MWFSALLALALFGRGAATAQEVKQIKLTDKHTEPVSAAWMRNGVATWLMQRGDQLLTSAGDGQPAEIQTFTVEIAFALRDSGSAKMLRSAYNWKVPRP